MARRKNKGTDTNTRTGLACDKTKLTLSKYSFKK